MLLIMAALTIAITVSFSGKTLFLGEAQKREKSDLERSLIELEKIKRNLDSDVDELKKSKAVERNG